MYDRKQRAWRGTTLRVLLVLIPLAIVAVHVALRNRKLSIWDVSILKGARDLLGSRGPALRKVLPKLVLRAPLPVANCSLPVKQSAFAGSCKLLRNVCLDQGRIILYEPRYRPRYGNGPPIDLPELVPGARQKAFYLQYWNQSNKDMKHGLPAVIARPASAQEPRRYLTDPTFSTCTVPVLFYQHNSFNFAHTFRDNAARFYSALQETVWAEHAKILLQTGGGLVVTPMNLALWQPISNMSVDSLAEFSVRVPDEQIGKRRPGQDPLLITYEGTEQRCFKSMYVCLNDIATRKWQLHAYGQSLVRHYNGEALLWNVPEVVPPDQLGEGLPPPESILKQLGKAPVGRGGRSYASDAAKEQFLRIVFQKRNSLDRQLLNAAELVTACNKWRYTTPSGARVRALCWEVKLTSLKVGIVAAQQADIFVGAHGANIANAWFMRPGSSIIELTMFEFDNEEAHMNLAKRNMLDMDTQVQFWKLLLCDSQGSWTSGVREARKRVEDKASDLTLAKFRNLVVRWDSLRMAIQEIVETGGDMQLYRQRYAEGCWWWLSGAMETAYAGPDLDMTCKRAKTARLIRDG